MIRVLHRMLWPVSWFGSTLARIERLFAARFTTFAGRPAEALPRAEPISGQTPRVLVVDDDPEQQLAACEFLSGWGITAHLAGDGAEAVALACGHDYDLILMDLQMPVLDGLSATAQIREFERERSCPRAPVVAYTSCGFDAELLRKKGVDATLEKPCSAETLRDCVERWCPRLHVRTGLPMS